MYYCILLGLCRSCAPRFLLCISLYVTCSMSCTFCVYVICAPSHLAPRIPFLYTVVRHTLSVCSFSTLRRFGRFASDCIDTANLPHRDFVFIHPSSSASLVAGRLNYGVVQAVSAANVRGLVIRAHDVRQFAFSVNWVRRADLPHILSYGFWASAHPFLSHYLTTCPSVLPNFVAAGSLVCTAWVVRRGFLCKGFLLAILGDGVWGFCGLPMFPYMCFTMCPVPSLLLLSVHIVCNCFTVHM